MNPNLRRLIIIGLVVISVIVVAIVTWSIVTAPPAGSVEVNITVVPSDSTFTIDDKSSKPGKTRLMPGQHTLKASHQYFKDALVAVDTKDLKNGQVIYVLPVPNSDQANQWLRDHPDQQMQREAAGGIYAQQTQQTILQKYPFVGNLPYETTDYKIDYSLSADNQNVSLQVTLYPWAPPDDQIDYKQNLIDFKNGALQYLKSQNVDTSKIQITFTPNPDQ